MKIEIHYNGHIDGYWLYVEYGNGMYVNEEIDELLPIPYEDLVYKYDGFKDTSEDFYGFYFETEEDAKVVKRIILNSI